MATIRVEVTAAHIAEAGDERAEWATPVVLAIAELAGVSVEIDGNGDLGCIATIGSRESSTLVVELPSELNAWLDNRWLPEDRVPSEPIAFDLVIDDWLVALVAGAAAS